MSRRSARPSSSRSSRSRRAQSSALPTSKAAATALVAVGRRFYDRGWVMGTSGNFSVVVGRDPLCLAITPSGAHKGALEAPQILQIAEDGQQSRGPAGRPSAETAIHLQIVARREAGAVLHTHSVWSTMLSERHAPADGLAIHDFEMLKGLDGVSTHAHREWVPIIDNDQDMTRMAGVVDRLLVDHPAAHGFLIRRHGLYTWGRTLADAERHVEILEFLFEAIGREGGHHGSRQRA
jgi:methylthioribulose-1-phosphate dehydratase